ncbi:AraC family transcriptional regulator [Arthrobacter sp. SDTb3-6]|uniref:helix-turn-helix domain-containing protein n=1 Tax=Arthrobacter sp. SDTb3-6 TaxID=2713571 RepID=UPI00159DA510|nr:AraC family transcriptional regulator [Arthrobacter sp. SDTb3-6]NVN00507.1 AraC family transcriptional regulator [Arthrobacter sp. SDTb3-6]
MTSEHPPGAKALRFSTDGIPSVNRVHLWEHHNAKALIALDIRTMDEQPLQAAEINLHFPSLKFASVRGSAQVVERNEAFIRRHPTNSVAVFFAIEGEAFFYYQGGFESLRPGQAVIYDVDRPFMRGFSRGLREMVLTIPHEDYLEITGGRPLTRPIIFDFREEQIANRRAFALARLVSDALSRPGDAESTEAAAFELLSAILAGDRSGTGACHLTAARSYITEHLGDTELSVAKVAFAVGISERHLARLFNETGTSASAYIFELRLQLARRLLTDQREARSSIATLAGRCGFASQAYFARAYKARYAVTPSMERKAALTEGAKRLILH